MSETEKLQKKGETMKEKDGDSGESNVWMTCCHVDSQSSMVVGLVLLKAAAALYGPSTPL